ncbi:MAG: hypothetical protein [Podoviridae sp. cty5g4]|nr:MAG: hypothetical protein [Podoviridae sp. cty5g4]
MSVINGINCTPGGLEEPVICGNAAFFTAYALSSTSYVYNGAGGQGATDGLIPIAGAGGENGRRLITYNIVNPTGTVTLGIFGKNETGLEVAIAEPTFAAAASGVIEITEPVSKIRIGLKISAGSATVTVTGKFIGMSYSPTIV